MELKFTIPGEPKGKGRPRFSQYGGRVWTRTPKETVMYENQVKLFYQNECGGQRFDEGEELLMELYAYYGIPKSISKRKREEMEAHKIRPTKKPDLDNILKAVADSLNGIAYKDDSQIVTVVCRKYYSDVPRVEVVLKSIEGGEKIA